MTIGPAPMMRTLFMSVLFGMFFHHACEPVEEISDVVRPRAGFGVALKTKCRPVGPRESLKRAIKQRYVSRPKVGGHRRRVYSKAVVLAGDHHPPALEILDRMVRAVMAEFHLHGLRARGEPHQLMAEADAEHRDPGRIEDLADRLDGVIAGPGVSRPVRQKNAVRPHSENLFCRKLGRNHRHPRAAPGEHAQDVALDAVVASDDVETLLARALIPLAELPQALGPLVGLLHRDQLCE